MKRLAILSTAVAGALLGNSVASADIMVGSLGADWRNPPALLNQYSDTFRAYWDNPSRDAANPSVGGPYNIANYLASSTFSTSVTTNVAGPSIHPQWWGKLGLIGQTFDLNPYFTKGTSERTIVATLLLESTDNANSNVVGWYDVDNPSDRTVLWNGAASRTNAAEVSFTPTDNWGFWMTTSRGTYYMQSLLSSTDKTYQHFAFCQANAAENNEVYYLGIEDLPVGQATPEGYGDFNDFIFKFQVIPSGNPVPEPTSLALLGIGSLALLARRRK